MKDGGYSFITIDIYQAFSAGQLLNQVLVAWCVEL